MQGIFAKKEKGILLEVGNSKFKDVKGQNDGEKMN